MTKLPSLVPLERKRWSFWHLLVSTLVWVPLFSQIFLLPVLIAELEPHVLKPFKLGLSYMYENFDRLLKLLYVAFILVRVDCWSWLRKIKKQKDLVLWVIKDSVRFLAIDGLSFIFLNKPLRGIFFHIFYQFMQICLLCPQVCFEAGVQSSEVVVVGLSRFKIRENFTSGMTGTFSFLLIRFRCQKSLCPSYIDLDFST